jgi:hypothetical protein
MRGELWSRFPSANADLPTRAFLSPQLKPREAIHLHIHWPATLPTPTRHAMETAQQTPAPGSLSWKLSSHPITLLTFLFFRICTCSCFHRHASKQ